MLTICLLLKLLLFCNRQIYQRIERLELMKNVSGYGLTVMSSISDPCPASSIFSHCSLYDVMNKFTARCLQKWVKVIDQGHYNYRRFITGPRSRLLQRGQGYCCNWVKVIKAWSMTLQLVWSSATVPWSMLYVDQRHYNSYHYKLNVTTTWSRLLKLNKGYHKTGSGYYDRAIISITLLQLSKLIKLI